MKDNSTKSVFCCLLLLLGALASMGQSEAAHSGPQANDFAGTDTFDFVPNTHVFFFDDFSNYPTGRLPAARYKIRYEGNKQGIAVSDSGKYVWLQHYNGNSAYSIAPIMNNPDLLSDSFSIELEFGSGLSQVAVDAPWDYFWFKLLNSTDSSFVYISVRKNEGYTYKHNCPGRDKKHEKSTSFTTQINKVNSNGWHHFAMSYNTGTTKVYIDKHKLISFSGCSIFPSEFRIGSDDKFVVRNLIMATGPLESPFSNILTDDKLVTHAIIFEVNKAAIALSGKRYLKEMANFLSEHTEIKLEISGHTDNDGTPENNLKLSQARANAVKKHLTLLGIDESRLTTKGYGESRPLKPNSSPEGKQENRRVEFRKL